MTKAAAVAWREELGRQGKRVVFTNGVFDILHPGHVRYLDRRPAARATRSSSPSTPTARCAPSRARSAPSTPRPTAPRSSPRSPCVDAAVVFDEDTPHDIISAIQPDVLVKGADWAHDKIVGRDIVEARGGVVIRVPVEEGHSTTGVIDKLRQQS